MCKTHMSNKDRFKWYSQKKEENSKRAFSKKLTILNKQNEIKEINTQKTQKVKYSEIDSQDLTLQQVWQQKKTSSRITDVIIKN